MAKKKKKGAPPKGQPQKKKGGATEQKKAKKKSPVSKDEYTVKDYAVINVIFWAFCLALYFIVWAITGENTGLQFLFGVLAIGFTLMSIFDYLYDYFDKKKSKPRTT